MIAKPDSFRETLTKHQANRLCDSHLKHVAERVFRILDASVPAGRQNNALQSLVAEAFQDEFGRAFHSFQDYGVCETGEAGNDDLPHLLRAYRKRTA